MSEEKRSNKEGCAGWFKWLVGTFIALLGALGGLVALLDRGQTPPPSAAPTPIVITINSGNSGSDGASGTDQQSVVKLPEDVFVPTAVPTPMPIVNQPNTNRPTEEAVTTFLYEAVLAETAAYLYLDSSYVSWYFAGDLLSIMETEIASLLNEGIIQAKYYDQTLSYIVDIQFVDDFRIEVDSCEVWSADYFSVWDSSYLSSDAPALVPQTIVIEQLGSGWFITDVIFYNAPAFCS
ncbi:MAG: hypothetical protein IPM53_06480 [Anaerolineaceae bacterium]|nr:hypothetical protein [Anaerolineaceae bacterium]